MTGEVTGEDTREETRRELCEECRRDLIDHAFSELPPARAHEVSRHLAGCADCALEFCRLRADLDGVTEAYAESPRPAIAHALRERVRAEVGGRPRWARAVLGWISRPVPAYGAAIAAAAPLLLWAGLRMWPPEASTPRESIGPAVIEAYDASTIVPIDANLL